MKKSATKMSEIIKSYGNFSINQCKASSCIFRISDVDDKRSVLLSRYQVLPWLLCALMSWHSKMWPFIEVPSAEICIISKQSNEELWIFTQKWTDKTLKFYIIFWRFMANYLLWQIICYGRLFVINWKIL